MEDTRLSEIVGSTLEDSTSTIASVEEYDGKSSDICRLVMDLLEVVNVEVGTEKLFTLKALLEIGKTAAAAAIAIVR